MYSTKVAKNMAGVLSDSRLVDGGRITFWKITVCVTDDDDGNDEATIERCVDELVT